jgi:ABC-type phosphate transport system substrate-binding protein
VTGSNQTAIECCEWNKPSLLMESILKISPTVLSKLFVVCLLIASTVSETRADERINIDGTVHMYEISEALLKTFQEANPNLTVVTASSGSGGGFKIFSRGETDITRSARRIKMTEKKDLLAAKIQYLELPIADSRQKDETLYLYINLESLQKKTVRDFLKFCQSKHGQEIIAAKGSMLPKEVLNQSRMLLQQNLKPFERQ